LRTIHHFIDETKADMTTKAVLGPPVPEEASRIKLCSLIVKTVRDLVAVFRQTPSMMLHGMEREVILPRGQRLARHQRGNTRHGARLPHDKL
jgi:hypothetical protein